MAKAFGGMGAGLAQGMTSNGSPGGIRPMPRPAGLGGVEVVAARPPQQQGGFLAQQFGPQGSEHRYEMAMQMLTAAMSGAQGSNSPALAFLTPLLGAAVGAKVTNMRDQYVGEEQRAMTEGLLGGPLNAQAQQALEVLNNPDAPDYLKQIAGTMFRQNAIPVGEMAQPVRRSGGGGRRSSSKGSGRSSKPPAATPVAEVAVAAPAAPWQGAPMEPVQPVMPSVASDPVQGVAGDDALIRKYLTN